MKSKASPVWVLPAGYLTLSMAEMRSGLVTWSFSQNSFLGCVSKVDTPIWTPEALMSKLLANFLTKSLTLLKFAEVTEPEESSKNSISAGRLPQAGKNSDLGNYKPEYLMSICNLNNMSSSIGTKSLIKRISRSIQTYILGRRHPVLTTVTIQIEVTTLKT